VARLAQDLRQRGCQIAAVTGPFGVLQATHVELLRDARRRADVVIVGIHRTDEAAHRDRIDVLLALRDVDFVCVVDDAGAFLEALRPDVHVETSAQVPHAERRT
jgi:bifunctional ADP-heptose synthase (sugar kinase/adenylyltransferase)